MKQVNLEPMNEDTEMVVLVLINVEPLYNACQQFVKESKTPVSLANRIITLLRDNRQYVKNLSGGADMRKVNYKRIADYFWHEE